MATTTEIIKTHLENIKRKIAENMASRSVSGRSVNSLRVEIGDSTATLWGSSSFLAMERGRGPGAVPKGFHEIIKEWAVKKGVTIKPKYQGQSTEGALNSFAGAVAHTIMTKGTRLFRSGRHEEIYSAAINEELQIMGDALVIDVLDKVSTINEGFI